MSTTPRTPTTLQRLARRLRGGAEEVRDAGASALEWAIIAAVVVVAASLIGGTIYGIVQRKSAELESCATTAVGSSCGNAPAAG